jgi:repressor LexA
MITMMDFHNTRTNGPTHYTTSEVVYGFIQDYVHQEGFPPSLSEIAEGCGLDISTVVYHLKRLRLWGFIRQTSGKARRILLVDNVRRAHQRKVFRRRAVWQE